MDKAMGKAMEYFQKAGESHYQQDMALCQHCVDLLAAALRSFRDEGIEEAAKYTDCHDPYYSDGIRALKTGGKA